MATTIENPILQAPRPALLANNKAQFPDQDAQKLSALVRSSLANIDRLTLEHVVRRAYQMGNESCHRAMAARVEDQPVTLEEIERRAIERAFSSMHGDAIRTAKLLGISKSSIYRKLRQYGLVTPRIECCPNCGYQLRVPRPQ